MTTIWTARKARVAADFSAAAGSYDRAARLQRQVLSILLERLQAGSPEPETLLDLGCGTGLALSPLAARFPRSRLLALDLAEGMIRHARLRQSGERNAVQAWLVADAEAMPLSSAALDLVFSSLAIQWCENTPALFEELGRVLKPGGRLLLSTLVQGTLQELRAAWREVDPDHDHVNRFLSVEALSLDVRRIFPSARIEIVPLRLMYSNLLELLRELKDLGARYKDASKRARATAPGQLRNLIEVYDRYADDNARLPATYQVAIIQV